MASFYSDALLYKERPPPTHSTTLSFPARPKFRLRKHGRRLPVVHLGGGNKNQPPKRRRGFFLSRLFRRVRLKWSRLQYSSILKKLKRYYRSLIKDIIEASASSEYQQRAFMESSLAVPGLGVSFSNYPSRAAALRS